MANVPYPHWTVPGPAGLVAYPAQAGGGPRVQVYQSDRLTGDFFAFEDTQRGGVNVAWGFEQPEPYLYTMPGEGGGPLLKVFDKFGREVKPAAWQADPNARASWVPVTLAVMVAGPSPPPVETLIQIPAVTVGDVTDPSSYVVYLAWERPPQPAYSPDAIRRVMTDLAAVYSAVRRLCFTTMRPDHQPAWYGTCVLGAPMGWSNSGGQALANWCDGNANGQSEAVLCGYEKTTPEAIYLLAGHEIAHGFGWQHGPDGDFTNDMAAIQAGVNQAIQNRPPS